MSNYLLGKLEEPDRSRLEEEVFADDALFAEMLAIEDGLIADFLDNKLSPDERERFATYFLSSPERRRHFETQRDIRNRAAEVRHPDIDRSNDREVASAGIFSALLGIWRPVIAAFFLIVLSGSIWFVWRSNRTEETARLPQNVDNSTSGIDAVIPSHDEPDVNAGQPAGNENSENVNGELPSRPAASKPSFATFTLTPGSTRGGAGTRLKLSPDVRTVILKLSFEGRGHSIFDVAIQTPEGKAVWQRSGISSPKRPNSLSLSIPASSLSKGEYILTISGRDADGREQKLEEYSFGVDKP